MDVRCIDKRAALNLNLLAVGHEAGDSVLYHSLLGLAIGERSFGTICPKVALPIELMASRGILPERRSGQCPDPRPDRSDRSTFTFTALHMRAAGPKIIPGIPSFSGLQRRVRRPRISLSSTHLRRDVERDTGQLWIPYKVRRTSLIRD
jgi:hypothetical protein